MDNKFETFLATLTESVDYSDDENPITVVTPDEHHRYERVSGILYELNRNGDNQVIEVSQIEHTPENSFYQEHIDAYVDYIREGGALESFPVQADPTLSRREVLEKFSEDIDWLIEMDMDYDIEGDSGVDVVDFYEFVELFETFFDTTLESSINQWDFEWDTENYFDEDEPEDAAQLSEAIKYIEQLNAFVKKIDQIIEEEDVGVYTLTDMNHRFAAVKELGIQKVWAEMV